MPRVKRLVIVGCLTFLLGLLVLFPARVAYQWFAPPGLAVSGIDGTVWNGSAASGTANGIYLSDLHWKLRPAQLLTGKLGYTMGAKPGSGFFDSDVAVGLGGKLEIKNLRASLPLQLLQGLARMPGMRGTVNANLDELRFDGGVPVLANGTVQVADLLVPPVDRAPLGAFRAEFQTQDDVIAASVQDTAAVIDLVGRLLLHPDRRYEFLGHVAGTDDTPEQLRQQLQYLGSANESGQHELRLEGTY